jgi:cellulose synthase/poly-beta-1,6-N-acetylglucosamine synthase-like glycosyltransferase
VSLPRLCPYCRGTNRDEATFCKICGGQLPKSFVQLKEIVTKTLAKTVEPRIKTKVFPGELEIGQDLVEVRLSKNRLITLLKGHGINDLGVLEEPDVNEENLVLVLRRNKLEIGEGFFKQLARELGLPFLTIEQLKGKGNLATILPYRLLKENLILPCEVSSDKIRLATSNPLNRRLFSVLASIFVDMKLELCVASTDAIEESLEQGYKQLHNDRALYDLYYRRPDESAHEVLYPWQRHSIIGLLSFVAILFVLNYPISLVFIFSSINITYFVINPLKFYISFKGFRGSRRTVHVLDSEVENLDEKNLSIYSILIPVYGEAEVLHHILQNVYKMNYPKNKLDVKILMEERDEETLREARRLGLFGRPETVIQPMTKEQYMEFLKIFDAVVVPDAGITTKPRACNFGLLRAKGKYCVIYDAEDDPEPDQLKKAVIAFSRVEENCACLQSRLNFYNPKENLLTRWFSLEYSFWYDHYLEGLDRVGAPFPLGGTSNHFRTKQLRELGGWDPYNMTEDADLGVRIARGKMRTAMLNSYTYEEANNKLGNWIRQRSRWNKGYIQTYLVHMRQPRQLIKDIGLRQFFFFQLTFGGNILLPLINSLLWAVTFLALLIPGIFSFLFFYPIVYLCAVNLAIGNSVYILLHLGPYVLRKNYTSIPFALAIPLYWILISIGAWKGVIQLITKPFYWEKTQHGLSKIHNQVVNVD